MVTGRPDRLHHRRAAGELFDELWCELRGNPGDGEQRPAPKGWFPDPPQAVLPTEHSFPRSFDLILALPDSQSKKS